MPTVDLLEAFSVLCTLMGLIYLDYAQTVMTSGLLAMLVANYTRNVGDARLWSISLLLLIQTVLYILLLIVAFVVFPIAHNAFAQEHWVLAALTPPFILLCFAALRELVLAVLWGQLTILLNADASTLDNLDRLERMML